MAGMQTGGFTVALAGQKPELDSILTELAVERAAEFKALNTPLNRLGMLLVQTLLVTDAANRARAEKAVANPAAVGGAVNPDLVAASADL